MKQDTWDKVVGPVFGVGLVGKDRLTPASARSAPSTWPRSLPEDSLKKVRYYIDCGDDDFLIRGNCALHLAPDGPQDPPRVPGPRRRPHLELLAHRDRRRAEVHRPELPPMSAGFRERLLRGDRLIGTLLSLPSPELAEIASDAGFDWLFLDMEHGGLDAGDVLRMVQAVARAVRLPRPRPREPRDVGQEGPGHRRRRHHRSPRQRRRARPPGPSIGPSIPPGGRPQRGLQPGQPLRGPLPGTRRDGQRRDGRRRPGRAHRRGPGHRGHPRRRRGGRRLHRPLRPFGQPGQARADPGPRRPRGHPDGRVGLRREGRSLSGSSPRACPPRPRPSRTAIPSSARASTSGSTPGPPPRIVRELKPRNP